MLLSARYAQRDARCAMRAIAKTDMLCRVSELTASDNVTETTPPATSVHVECSSSITTEQQLAAE